MPVEQWGEAGEQAKRQSPCKGGAIVLQMMSLFAFQGQALHVDFYLVQRCKKCSCSGKIIIEECSAEMGMWVSVLKLQNLNVCQHNAATLELCFLFFFFSPKLNIKVTRVWCALVRSGLKQKHPSSKQPCEASFSCSQRHRELLFSSTDISCGWLEGDMLGARLHGHWPWEHPPEPWRLLLDMAPGTQCLFKAHMLFLGHAWTAGQAGRAQNVDGKRSAGEQVWSASFLLARLPPELVVALCDFCVCFSWSPDAVFCGLGEKHAPFEHLSTAGLKVLASLLLGALGMGGTREWGWCGGGGRHCISCCVLTTAASALPFANTQSPSYVFLV